jgi:hypothetical protein
MLALVCLEMLAAFALGVSIGAASLLTVTYVVVNGTVGSLLASRLPGHPVGWLLITASVCFATGGLLVTYVERALVSAPGSLPVGPLTVLASNWFFGLGSAIAATFVLLLFPTGHLPSARWKPVAWTAAIATLLMLLGVTLSPDPFEGLPIANPFALSPDDPLGLVVEGGGVGLLLLTILASVASLILRFRRAAMVERQQLKWAVFAVIILAIGLLGSYSLELANGPANLSDEFENTVITIGLSLLPVAIAVAILRYRLYEIDRLISRTVGYVLVVVVLGLVYAIGAVWLPTRLMGEQTPPLFVAGSTLVVAALFNPVRRRVLHWVDRRFYRSRYDGERVVSEFSGRLRDQTDVDQLADDWVSVVAETVQPSSVGVWVRDR